MNSHKDIQVDIDTDMSVHVGKDMDMGIDYKHTCREEFKREIWKKYDP